MRKYRNSTWEEQDPVKTTQTKLERVNHNRKHIKQRTGKLLDGTTDREKGTIHRERLIIYTLLENKKAKNKTFTPRVYKSKTMEGYEKIGNLVQTIRKLYIENKISIKMRTRNFKTTKVLLQA